MLNRPTIIADATSSSSEMRRPGPLPQGISRQDWSEPPIPKIFDLTMTGLAPPHFGPIKPVESLFTSDAEERRPGKAADS